MKNTAPNTDFFKHEVRVLACTQCGAPLNAALPGSFVSCQYCQASLQVGTRDDRAVLDSLAKKEINDEEKEINEEERLRKLRAQDGKPLRAPSDLKHLFGVGGAIEPNKIQEAISLWNEARAELTKFPSSKLEERLYFLSLVLYQNLGDDNAGTHHKRALLESSLEILRLSRHRQVILCTISRLAVFDGDDVAAEAWLNDCDPYSEDLETDSHYRFAKAFLHTAREEWQEVLTILGHDARTIPIHDALDSICYLLRANAHERSGNLAMATELLHEVMDSDEPHSIAFLDRMMDRYHEYQLCPVSYPSARQHYLAAKGSDASSTYKVIILVVVLFACLAFLAAFLWP